VNGHSRHRPRSHRFTTRRYSAGVSIIGRRSWRSTEHLVRIRKTPAPWSPGGGTGAGVSVGWIAERSQKSAHEARANYLGGRFFSLGPRNVEVVALVDCLDRSEATSVCKSEFDCSARTCKVATAAAEVVAARRPTNPAIVSSRTATACNTKSRLSKEQLPNVAGGMSTEAPTSHEPSSSGNSHTRDSFLRRRPVAWHR
jgi:hypothetical protein